MIVALAVALVAALVLWTYRHRHPSPEPWSAEDELVAVEVARTLGVTMETARLAVLAWR